MANKKYDFSGWATRNDILCSDGRTIKKDAFIENNGQTVPLVWNHQHNEANNILGHAELENRPEGVYCYCTFNNTDEGQHAKELVVHGDIDKLSIYANKLKQNGGNVIHGCIREVSLVLAGANKGAIIDSVMAHGEYSEDEAVIIMDTNIELFHSDSLKDDLAALEPDQEGKKEPAKEPEKKEGKKVEETQLTKEVIDSTFKAFSDDQKKVIEYLIGAAIEDAKNKEAAAHSDEGDGDMTHNIFEGNDDVRGSVISHSDIEGIFKDAQRCGSLREAVHNFEDAHADTLQHGITDIDYLFPDAKNLTNEPVFINNEPSEWVKVVMDGVKHSPMSRVRMMFADIREDEARAKGFLKGNMKKEEVFSLLKRTVEPTTVYKLQKMHRDDIIDITDFNVVAWIKGEMQVKLKEEIARAVLFGDGRLASSDEHIDTTKIIPAYSDAALYTITKTITPDTGETDPHATIRTTVEAMDDYQGSGNAIGFFKRAKITKMLLMEDTLGHRLYKNEADLASAMTLSKIVAVPANIVPTGVEGLILDLKDYQVGADKGGETTMFDDFDIDYNKYSYLMETRCSGALTKPFSSIVLKSAAE